MNHQTPAIPVPLLRKQKKLAGALALLWPMITQAYVWLVVSITVIVVGGFMLYKIYQTAKLIDQPQTPPPYPQPPAVSKIYLDLPDTGQDILLFDNEGTAAAVAQPAAYNPRNPLSINFAKLGDNEPYLSQGTNYWCGGADGQVLGTTNCYNLDTYGNGSVYHIHYDSTNGYATTVTSTDTNLYHLIIQRSTNMVDWVPVYDWWVYRWNMQYWNDPNTFDRAFYRVYESPN